MAARKRERFEGKKMSDEKKQMSDDQLFSEDECNRYGAKSIEWAKRPDSALAWFAEAAVERWEEMLGDNIDERAEYKHDAVGLSLAYYVLGQYGHCVGMLREAFESKSHCVRGLLFGVATDIEKRARQLEAENAALLANARGAARPPLRRVAPDAELQQSEAGNANAKR